jgi:hypothetical protein
VIGWYWGATILSTVGFGEITPSSKIATIKIIFRDFLSALYRCSVV